MANLGNTWHIPNNPELHCISGMRDPIGAIVPETAVTVITGNQFQDTGNPGNQLQDGSAVFFRKAASPNWTLLPFSSSEPSVTTNITQPLFRQVVSIPVIRSSITAGSPTAITILHSYVLTANFLQPRPTKQKRK